MEEGLAVAGRGGAGIREGTRGLERRRQVTVVLEIAGFNATELSAYCRERGLFPEQVSRWLQAARRAA